MKRMGLLMVGVLLLIVATACGITKSQPEGGETVSLEESTGTNTEAPEASEPIGTDSSAIEPGEPIQGNFTINGVTYQFGDVASKLTENGWVPGDDSKYFHDDFPGTELWVYTWGISWQEDYDLDEAYITQLLLWPAQDGSAPSWSIDGIFGPDTHPNEIGAMYPKAEVDDYDGEMEVFIEDGMAPNMFALGLYWLGDGQGYEQLFVTYDQLYLEDILAE